MLVRYRMTLAYDGSAFWGWQTQPGHRTIQGELERVLKILTGEGVRVHCSGRTDRGVHAREQVAHFDVHKELDVSRLLRGLNGLLDDDLRVLDLRKAPRTFHARRSATGKEYRYFIWNGPILPPWLRLYRTHVRQALDVERMQKAAARLVGRKDFAAFSANPHREVGGTVRHLRELTVRRRGREVVIVARADGFLYKMVRSLAGFLIRVGTGEMPPEAATIILRSRTRTAHVPTAPPQGLFLWRVEYPKSQRSA